MIECYYRWCQHHSLDEPFCKLDDCVAEAKEMARFERLRREERATKDDRQQRNSTGDPE